MREALALVAAQGDRHREAALRNNLADTLHRAGRDDEAMEELKRAVAIFAEVGGHDDEPQPRRVAAGRVVKVPGTRRGAWHRSALICGDRLSLASVHERAA